MPSDPHIVDPLEDPRWDKILLSQPNHSFFHCSAWMRVLRDSYGFKPVCLLLKDGSNASAMLPLMEVNSPFTGKRGVSLPFSDMCKFIAGDSDVRDELVGAAIDYGRTHNWQYVEFRSRNGFPVGTPASSSYYHHTLDLSLKENEIFAGLRSSVRRAVRKAMREGVEVGWDTSLEAVKEFYRLNVITRRGYGLPPQPFPFFCNLHRQVLSKNMGTVVTARYDNKPIASAVFVSFDDMVLFKYGASDYRYQHLRGNDLVMWHAIRMYAQSGARRMSLGRTDLDHVGLRRFKLGWGAAEETLNYYKYDIRSKMFLTDGTRFNGWHNHVFRRLPAPLLRLAGRLLYRHVA